MVSRGGKVPHLLELNGTCTPSASRNEAQHGVRSHVKIVLMRIQTTVAVPTVNLGAQDLARIVQVAAELELLALRHHVNLSRS